MFPNSFTNMLQLFFLVSVSAHHQGELVLSQFWEIGKTSCAETTQIDTGFSKPSDGQTDNKNKILPIYGMKLFALLNQTRHCRLAKNYTKTSYAGKSCMKGQGLVWLHLTLQFSMQFTTSFCVEYPSNDALLQTLLQERTLTQWVEKKKVRLQVFIFLFTVSCPALMSAAWCWPELGHLSFTLCSKSYMNHMKKRNDFNV